nr:hypothetical protein [Brevibacillus laterosporus]
MKKLVLTGVLSVGTLLGANLPGLEIITVNAANPSSLSIAESNSQQTEDFIIGSIIESDSDYGYVVVEYINNEGKKEKVEVILSVGHSYKVGDKVKVSNKGKWEHTRIAGNNVVLASEDSISKVIENETEDFIIGSVKESDSNYGYVVVEYKNNEGKKEKVEVILSVGHSYKVGDKVKVSNKGKWEHTRIAGNNVVLASEDSISKVIENETEDFIIGSVKESDSNYGYVVVEYKNNEGKKEKVEVILSVGHSYKVGDKVKVSNKGKWEHTRIAGNNVVLASEDSISKVIENETEDFIIGSVKESDSNYGYVVVEYKNNEGKKEKVEVILSVGHSYKVGDKVKVSNKGKWEHTRIAGNNVVLASEDSISKVIENETEDFIIGSVKESDSNYGYVVVEYKNNEGKKEKVEVILSVGHSYKVGDKVKVSNKGKWEHTRIAGNNVVLASEDSISKVIENEK